MKEESQKVTAAVITLHGGLRVILPDSPYQMWVAGELHDYLHIPHDGTRIEIIDGELVVSPAPRFRHNAVILQIIETLANRRNADPSYRWRCIHSNELGFVAEENGYIPDLIVMDAEIWQGAWDLNPTHLVTDQAEIVIEVTSPATAKWDRPPTGKQTGKGKWCGYARAEIPYYLLIDLDPSVSRISLYSIPDQASGAYLHQESWSLGETITLPDPIEIEIPTEDWKPWD
ncbi:putative restriction endonuclease [Nonomuraea polychroma]|uniref:Putative restriction endonuclease n=1 Tax=Nonomuraea polychroma TaxID=46176 RepID=A0A438MN72_9ACTN|nr:Uma2 family endonuclease [Nonomuraea polychroma]RVX47170.1 putative restriction endonuclease [Nonomuraea polychroma]